MLNGTAVVDRMALAILENFQGEVPDVLVPSVHLTEWLAEAHPIPVSAVDVNRR